jgi:hypothetical protein
MNKLPGAALAAKQTGRTQGKRNKLLTTADFRLPALYFDDARQISGGIGRDKFDIGDLSVAIIQRGAVYRFLDLPPTVRIRPERITQRYIISIREQRLRWHRIASKNSGNSGMAALYCHIEITRFHATPTLFQFFAAWISVPAAAAKVARTCLSGQNRAP